MHTAEAGCTYSESGALLRCTPTIRLYSLHLVRHTSESQPVSEWVSEQVYVHTASGLLWPGLVALGQQLSLWGDLAPPSAT